ncbi:MAG: hypothetical protein M1339_06265 [Bacteroidetes bacterium]|nr:hypothetical protein [Bacteroidota bacterium]
MNWTAGKSTKPFRVSRSWEGVDFNRCLLEATGFAGGNSLDIIQKTNRELELLPPGVSQPIALQFDISNIPVCTVVLSSNMGQRAFYDLAYNVIEPQLEHRDRAGKGGRDTIGYADG